MKNLATNNTNLHEKEEILPRMTRIYTNRYERISHRGTEGTEVIRG